ncbi:MAG: hypothetical protein EPN61_03485 [Burkholderiaceae bacterium]|nr:MAG: hypothetical protein EPN61_03485 [Burkholderiaceae bacterium]
MQTPAFFDTVPRIVVRDLLSETLGAASDGIIEYSYLDAVKLTGHSCPTVAGAYLMTMSALAHLYPDELPHRGELRVELRQDLDEGVAGVIASVAGLITGAANAGGFKGLGGRFSRRDLLRFGVPMQGELRFTRMDTGRAVEVAHNGAAVPRPPELFNQLQAASQPGASATTRNEFAATWQGWVRTMLLEHNNDPALIAIMG